MNTVIEIHALQNYAPSNLNRDETGAPKDAFFGGARRARISSQCLKRAVRQHFTGLIGQQILAPDDVGYRTTRVLTALTDALIGLGHPEDEAKDKARLALAAVELTIKEDGRSEYLLFLGKREISGIAQLIHAQWKSLVAPQAVTTEKKPTGKAKKQAALQADPELKDSIQQILNGGQAIDIALFGRMLADMPEQNVQAACQVAHAISTHSVEREFDFFTAVDDLKPQDSSGADMLGTGEFNSACFYRYALINWEHLVDNLHGDTELAARALRAFLDSFIVAEPSGKQNTFAAHNPPEFVAVSVRRQTAPRNLANAFETPVRFAPGTAITATSAGFLARKALKLDAAYGDSGHTYVLNLTDSQLPDYGTPVSSVKDLLTETLSAVLHEEA